MLLACHITLFSGGITGRRVFFDVQDYQFYLQLLAELLPRYGVELHAYVLMTNHVHLLMTPEDSESISRLTRVLGSRFAHYVNKQYGRTGTLWEGRHKSSLVDAALTLRNGRCPTRLHYSWSCAGGLRPLSPHACQNTALPYNRVAS